MPETQNQEEIDALLAEVSALAEEAVADIVGDGGPAEAPPPAASAGPGAGPAAPAAAATSLGYAPAAGGPTAPRTAGRPRRRGRESRGEVSRILRLEVPVIVQLAQRTMDLSEIVTLSTGAIVEFETPADADLDLMINNKCIGKGQAVKVGENFGLRMTCMGSVQDRIKALGPK